MVVPGRHSNPNRRIPSSSSPSNEKPEPSTAQTGASDTSPAVPPETIYKLLAFTFAMICAPLGAYFLSVRTVFSGNATMAGALAALTANVVLIAYVVVAWQEDKEDQAKRTEKKAQ